MKGSLQKIVNVGAWSNSLRLLREQEVHLLRCALRLPRKTAGVHWWQIYPPSSPIIYDTLVTGMPVFATGRSEKLISSRVCSRSPTEGAERACARASPLPVDKAITHDLQKDEKQAKFGYQAKGEFRECVPRRHGHYMSFRRTINI